MTRSHQHGALKVPSDGAPGLIAALEAAFPRSLRGRCWAHKMRKVVAKLPAEAVPELKNYLRQVRDAATHEAGELAAAEVPRRFGASYPAAMRCFEEDLQPRGAAAPRRASHPRAQHQPHIERSFVEERRRTRAVGRFFYEEGALKLVFATLDHLRRTLGLEAHPADAMSFTRSHVA